MVKKKKFIFYYIWVKVWRGRNELVGYLEGKCLVKGKRYCKVWDKSIYRCFINRRYMWLEWSRLGEEVIEVILERREFI